MVNAMFFRSINLLESYPNNRTWTVLISFYLTNQEGQCCLVCKKFFMSTLGMKTDRIITYFIQSRYNAAATKVSDG